MSMLKRRIISLETLLVPETSIEDLLRALRNEQKGVKVPDNEWQRIRISRVYEYLKSC